MNKNYNFNKTGYIIAGVIASMGCIVMILFPTISLNAAQKGVALWASSVLPALLPFFICANFITALGLPILIGHLFEKPFRKLFGAPGASAFVFTISITSGYPMGAKLIGDMARRGEITKAESKRMLTFCSTSGPLFMLGTVGAGMLFSPAAGVVIALSHYLGAVLNGIIFNIFEVLKKPFYTNKNTYINNVQKQDKHHLIKLPKGSLLDIFTDSIISSFKALGIICGYIVLFTLITDFIQFSGLLNFINCYIGKGIIKGFFEMTIGCSSISILPNLSLTLKCIICSVIISWGGLSIFAQSMSMLSGLSISPFYYIWTKFTHSIFSGFIAFCTAPFILSIDVINTGAFSNEIVTKKLGSVYSLMFSTKMVIIIIVIFMILIFIESRLQKYKEHRSSHEGTGDNI
ncbi:hypothetical protein [Anaerovorax odorimutans]|uniref:hypothetical protein n=1 Tax=Anaerovorax odorimutans TaxID=109327 RepID=UPI00040EAA21|nr:hypothetical protein [Anaerovorax odorimutans]